MPSPVVLAEVAQVVLQVVRRDDRIGVVRAQDVATAGQGILVELTRGLVLTQPTQVGGKVAG
jgi:hypothetical protein